jgi:hypothetical protein
LRKTGISLFLVPEALDGDGMPVFDRLRYRRQDAAVFLFAFDLIELNGQDLRREPIESRKRELAKLLRGLRRSAYNSTSTLPNRETSCSGTLASWVEAARVALPIRPVERLAQVQEPGSASGEARGGRGLGEGAMAMTGKIAS